MIRERTVDKLVKKFVGRIKQLPIKRTPPK